MLKRFGLALTILGLVLVACGAELPKLAVLDVSVPKNFDNSVVVPITESLMEQLVASNKYTVLDRANIEAIFAERDFQLSGEVSNAQITQAGQFLGASFIVVSKLQIVGNSYFLSAKMIDTKTAAILKQASDTQKSDDASIVIDMAQDVGAKLLGAFIMPPHKPRPTSAPVASAKPEPTPAPTPAPTPEPTPAPERFQSRDFERDSPPGLRITANLSLPTWNDTSNLGKVMTTLPVTLYNAGVSNTAATPLNIGFEAYAQANLEPWWYIAAEYDSLEHSFQDKKFPDATKYYVDSRLTNFMAGAGLSLPIANVAHVFGGMMVGISSFTLGSLWTEAFSPDWVVSKVRSAAPKADSLTENGLGYALEAGLSIYVLKILAIDVRARYCGAIFLGSGVSAAGKISATSYYLASPSATVPALDYTSISFGLGLAL